MTYTCGSVKRARVNHKVVSVSGFGLYNHALYHRLELGLTLGQQLIVVFHISGSGISLGLNGLVDGSRRTLFDWGWG